MTLGTESELAFVYKFGTIENIQEMKTSAATTRDTKEAEGKSDHRAARQQNIMSAVISELMASKLKCFFNTTMKMGQHTLTGAMVLSFQY